MQLKVIGASVRGPSHIATGSVNQDYLSLRGRKRGWIGAVCDGLGSHAYSDHGSKIAARAIQKVCRNDAYLEFSEKQINEKIHTLWLQNIAPFPVSKTSTTCLYTHVKQEGGEIIMGQLGDGLILYKENGQLHQLTPSRTGFGNQTTALGINYYETDWLNANCSLQKAGDGVILMSDGISDDLITESLPDFFNTIYHIALNSSRRRAKKWLQQELENWATPRHGDDKTLAAIFRV